MIEKSRVVWTPGAVTITSDEAMVPADHHEEQSELKDAQNFLRGLL